MNILDGLFVVQRSIPTEVLGGLATGQYSLHGGVVRDGAGQIVRHLVSATSSTGLDPFGMLSAVPSLVNVYQINQLKHMTEAILQISQATMLMSGLNLALGVAGFAALKTGLDRVDKRINELDRKLVWIGNFLNANQRGQLLFAVDQLSHLPSDEKNAFTILHTARATLGQAGMSYFQHWRNSQCLEEALSFQHFYCTAFIAQARCSAELGMHDAALRELRQGVTSWRQQARENAKEQILGEDRARYLHSRYVDKVPTAKLAGWLDFVSDEIRGYRWIDELRQEYSPSISDVLQPSIPEVFRPRPSSELSTEEISKIEYLDNLTSRDSVLRGYEAQLQFMGEHEIKPSDFSKAIKHLGETHPKDKMLVLEPTKHSSLEHQNAGSPRLDQLHEGNSPSQERN